MAKPLLPLLRPLLVCGALSSSLLQPALEAQALFRGLGPETTGAFDITPGTGVVVGYGRIGLTAARQAFRWSASSGMSDLGPNDPWYRSTVATGICDDGSVIVGQDGDEAFRWTKASGRSLLGIPAGSSQSAATGVSHDGSVVVGSGYAAETDRGRAFRWSGGTLQPLGLLPGAISSFATGVSGDGKRVVGYSGGFDLEAFLWTEGGGMVGLGSIAGAPQVYSLAQAISGDGSTIVGVSGAEDGFQAFRWTEAGGMVGLDPHSDAISAATAVSADGRMVAGNWLHGDGVDEAFIWTGHSGIRSLVDVITHDLGLGRELEGWSSLGAYALSGDGRYIAGTGYFRNEQQAWVLDRGPNAQPIGPPEVSPVPEPEAIGVLGAVLLGCGMGLRLWRRVRSSRTA